MLRDTLEMIPVAIILALILGFGMRPNRAPQATMRAVQALTVTAPTLDQPWKDANTAFSSRHGISNIDSEGATGVQEKSDDRIPSGKGSQELSPRTVSSAIFIPLHTPRSDVPFFTSRDITSGAGASRQPPPHNEASGSSESRSERLRLSVNQANVEELTRLPGLGHARAAMLVNLRPVNGYQTWEEVDALPGFGEATMDAMQRFASLN